MKLVTRDTDYAIRALCCIAGRGEDIVSVKELVDELAIPKPFLRKLLQMLSARGILESQKGQGGGFKLKVIPKNVSLLDLVEIFQGPFKLSEHVFKNEPCLNLKRCKLKKKLDDMECYVSSKLSNISLESLL